MNGRSFLGSLAAWVSTIVLLFFLVSEGRRAGPLTLARPSTVYANGPPAQRRWEPFILFLGQIRPDLPRGATVLLVQPGGADPWILQYRWLLAEAELPDQNVVPVTAAQIETRGRVLAPYAVDDSRGGLRSDGYNLLERFPGGRLFVAR